MPLTPMRRWVAAAMFLLALALYVSSAAPGLLWADGGELQAAAITFGIPHATGYPSFVLLGGLFARLGWADPAYGVNFMSCCFGALSIGLLVVVAGELGLGLGASAAAAAVFALTFTPWHTALRAEVYTLTVAFALLALWSTLVALRTGRAVHFGVAALLLGLTVTGHLSFAPAVAVAGVALAWKTLRAGPRPIPHLVLLLAAFLLGFAPYLQTWLADVRHAPINYFDMVRTVHSPLGQPLPDFDTPGERLTWLIGGRNQYPRVPLALSSRNLVVGSVESAFILFVFELGPLALALALAGLIAEWRANRGRTLALAVALAASIVFSALVITGAMMHLFLLPAMVLTVLFVAAGLEVLAGRVRNGGLRLLLLVALVALMVVPGYGLRDYADAHPLTRWKFRVEEEGATKDRAWIPSLRGEREPAIYGHRALEWIPRDALVLASWAELGVLRYLRAVEGARPDLTVQPTAWTTAADRMRVWQRNHDPAQHPFVFTERPPADGFAANIEDSTEVVPGRWLYVQRTPIAEPGDR